MRRHELTEEEWAIIAPLPMPASSMETVNHISTQINRS